MVANNIKEVSQKYNGFATRYGGDEFCLIIRDDIDINVIEHEIKQSLIKIYNIIGNKDMKLSLSIGSFKATY